MSVSKTQALYDKAKKIIPGGTQLLSKRPEMQAPDQWPAYFTEARGCEVWDLDGKHYYDMSTNGIGSCLLGYADPDVNAAAYRRIALGNMSTLNPPEEVELAERLISLHPWAQCARFARCGGEIGAVAVRIARATTDRSMVAICGYHGWHDWYLSANLGEDDSLRGHLLSGLSPLGVPRELRGTSVTFHYDSFDEFDAVMKNYGDKLACVIMEPVRHSDPAPGFLEHIREETRKRGILLIFDEITIGFRLEKAGSHLRFGVHPDLAIFAKALGNGYPIAAVIGTREAMDGAHDSFISSTYWTESIGPAAACAVLEKLSKVNAPAHAAHIGRRVLSVWKEYGTKHGLPLKVNDHEYPCLATAAFDHKQAAQLRTLFVQLMLDQGFLAPLAIYPTMAHTDAVVDLFGAAVDKAFAEISTLLKADKVEQALRGPVAHAGFKRLN